MTFAFRQGDAQLSRHAIANAPLRIGQADFDPERPGLTVCHARQERDRARRLDAIDQTGLGRLSNRQQIDFLLVRPVVEVWRMFNRRGIAPSIDDSIVQCAYRLLGRSQY